MKSNKAILPGVFFLVVGRGAVGLGVRMFLHRGFREIGKQTAPMAVKTLKRMKPTDILFQLPLSHRITVNLKTAGQPGNTLNPHLLSLAHGVIE